MRYLRKLAPLTLVALAMAATVTATAAANVTVTNDGPFAIDESPLETGTWSNGDEVGQTRCYYVGDGYVNGDGSLAIENIHFYSGPDTIGNCSAWDDCNDNGWTGQIVGPGHPDYLGVADFEAVMTVCLMEGTGLSGVPFESRLHINGDIEDQEWTWPTQNIVVPGIGPINNWIRSQPFAIDRTDFEVALEE